MNHYQVLDVSQDDSLEIIKRKYQQMVLQLHPDKANNSNDAENFIKVQKAWEVLRDEDKRKEYDLWLKEKDRRSQLVITDTIDREELQWDGEVWKHACRCGNDFIVYPEELDEYSVGNLIVPCQGCSLGLKIQM